MEELKPNLGIYPVICVSLVPLLNGDVGVAVTIAFLVGLGFKLKQRCSHKSILPEVISVWIIFH